MYSNSTMKLAKKQASLTLDIIALYLELRFYRT